MSEQAFQYTPCGPTPVHSTFVEGSLQEDPLTEELAPIDRYGLRQVFLAMKDWPEYRVMVSDIARLAELEDTSK